MFVYGFLIVLRQQTQVPGSQNNDMESEINDDVPGSADKPIPSRHGRQEDTISPGWPGSSSHEEVLEMDDESTSMVDDTDVVMLTCGDVDEEQPVTSDNAEEKATDAETNEKKQVDGVSEPSGLGNVSTIMPIPSKLENIIPIPTKPQSTQTTLSPTSTPNTRPTSVTSTKHLPLRISYPTPAYPSYQHLPMFLDALQQRLNGFWDVFRVSMMAKDADSGARQHGGGGDGNEGGPEKEKKTLIVFAFEGEYSVVGGGIGNGKGGKSDWKEREGRVRKVRKIIKDVENRIGVRFT